MIRLALVADPEFAALYAAAARRVQGAALAAVADTTAADVDQLAAALDVPIAARSLDALLANHGDMFDAVVVHRESATGAAQAKQAAEAGKHVFVEMPFTLQASEVDEVAERCAEAGVRLMVGQAARFLPAHQAVKQALQTGRLGAPGLLRIHHWEACESRPNGGTNPTATCAPLERLVCDIDLAHWLFESLPTEVYGLVARCSGATAASADFVQVHLGFPSGGMALIDFAALPGGSDYFALSMIGSAGAAYADDHHNMQLQFGREFPSAVKTSQGHAHLAAKLKQFVDFVTQSRAPAIGAADARAAAQVTEAVAKSIGSGRAARLVEDRYELV